MYLRPELRDALARFWDILRRFAPDAPSQLSVTDDPWTIWQSPDLWLSQTCGLPYRARLHDAVSLVGTPDYGLDGCPPGYYRSVFVSHCDDARRRLADFRAAPLAYNEPLSQSGWGAPFFHARRHGFAFDNLIRTGAHIASARAVAEGQADLAAIDAQSWRLMQRYDSWTTQLRVVDYTDPTPGLPLITAQHAHVPRIAEAVENAIAALTLSDRDALGFKGLVRIPQEAYMALPIPEKPDHKPRK